jgi:uncharacterized membrane protein
MYLAEEKIRLRINIAVLAVSITGLCIKHLSGYKSDWLSLILLSLIIISSARSIGESAASRVNSDPLILKRLFTLWLTILPGMFFVQQYLKYRAYNSELWDIGIISHAFSTTVRGYFFQNIAAGSTVTMSAFSQHTELILIILYPFFALFQHPLTLVAIQSVVMSVTVLCFYRLCRIILKDETASLLLSFCFSVYPAFLYSGILDFHGDVLALPFIILMITASIEKKRQSAIVFLVLSLLCKEYVALTGLIWGIYCLLALKEKKTGILLCIISSLWFTCAMLSQSYLRPSCIPSLFNIFYRIPAGSDNYGLCLQLLSVYTRIFSSGNIQNIVFLFIPMLFYCFKYPWIILFLILPFLKDVPYGMSIESHRLAIYIPFIWYCVIKGFQNGNRHMPAAPGRQLPGNLAIYRLNIKTKADLISLLIAALICSALFSEAPWSQRFIRNWESKYKYSSRAACLSRIVRNIPAETPVSVSPAIYPHLTNRHYLYLFPAIGNAEYTIVEKKRLDGAGFMAIDSLVKCGWSKKYENEYALLLKKSIN